ncbi:MAG TPA: hypothetical protein VEL03_05350 [Streptosporangiaceae bacterium]|nr:hypothetical protein [Streptosporangiaceae bacterium]
MANFLITDDTVTVELSGLEKVEAGHGNLTIPRSAITSAEVVPDGMDQVRGFKVLGTGLPGVIEAGTFRGSQGSLFAVCHGRKPAVVLRLTGQRHDVVVVTVENAEEVAAALG